MLAAVSPFSTRPGGWILNGLGDGVGRDDLVARGGRGPRPFIASPGENRVGTVPARALVRAGGILSEVGNCVL